MSIEAPSRPRSPWQLLYQAAHRVRRRRARRTARRLPRPVVSIGNLHLGGTGKTPLTAAVAGHLEAHGYTVAILSRGYGRAAEGIKVVSQGEGPLLGPSLAGDEPVLLAGLVPRVAVVVGADRFLAGRHALLRLDRTPDVFVLDDGFSHAALRREVDILAFPAADPFAGGRLLPIGRLREPLEAAGLADAVILTGLHAAVDRDTAAGAQLASALSPFGFAGPGFVSHTHIGPARLLGGLPLRRGARVVLVSAIARPASFEETALAQGFSIVAHLRYRDHHPYPESTLMAIRTAYQQAGAAAILVTQKDRVKLQGRLDLPLAEIPLAARPEPAFFTWLDQRVDAAVRKHRG